MHNRASVKRVLWLAKVFKRVATKTGTLTCPSAFISLPLHWVSRLYGLLIQAKPGHGGIVAQSWLNLLLLKCCLRKVITQSICYAFGVTGIFWDHTGLLGNPNMNTLFDITNYQSEFHIRSTFPICSLISHISITRPSYQ
jgi:hypothetical protein